jgi:hypothetical protein
VPYWGIQLLLSTTVGHLKAGMPVLKDFHGPTDSEPITTTPPAALLGSKTQVNRTLNDQPPQQPCFTAVIWVEVAVIV